MNDCDYQRIITPSRSEYARELADELDAELLRAFGEMPEWLDAGPEHDDADALGEPETSLLDAWIAATVRRWVLAREAKSKAAGTAFGTRAA